MSAAFAQDDCAGPGLTGTRLASVGANMSMVLAPGWQRSFDMGQKTNLWKATDTADGQQSYVVVGEGEAGAGIGPSEDAATTARDVGATTPVVSCTIGGQTAYETGYSTATATTDYLFLQHPNESILQVTIVASSQAGANTVIPQVKRMLGTWTWGS